MQYGNPCISSCTMFRLYSLNRTMQYGNAERWKEIDEGKEGLNRTMQYGNF